MHHTTHTMGGVVGLEKPDIVITHTDGTQTHAKRKKKEKGKYCQTGPQQSGFKWPIWSRVMAPPRCHFPPCRSLSPVEDRRVLLVSPLLAASCLGWQGNSDSFNKEISNPPTAYLHPECVVTGDGGRTPPPPPQTGLPVLLGSPPPAQIDH